MTADRREEGPQKLTFSATFVIWASNELTAAEKIVWFHDWALDRGGPDAAFMSTQSLAQRIAMEPKTVEQYRGRLRRLGLHESLHRRDARNLGWVATLPPECVPRGSAIAGKEAVRLAGLLDSHIRARDARLKQGSESDRHEHLEQTQIRPSDRDRQVSRSLRGADRDALGGGGARATSGVSSEAQLQLGVTERGTENGVGAPAPKPEVGAQHGKPKRLKPSEQPPAGEWLAFQEEMRRRRTHEARGW